MAFEFNTIYVQQVAANQNAVLSNDTVVSRCKNPSVVHRSGSGLICLSNSGVECNPAKYKVFVKGNIAIPTGGTVGAISLGLSLNGEVLQTSLATITPAAVEEFGAVSFEEIIRAGKCPANIAVVNPNTQTIEVENLTVIVERIC